MHCRCCLLKFPCMHATQRVQPPSSGWYLAQRDALLTSRFTQRHLLHYPMVGKIGNILWRVGRLYTNAMLESNCSRLHVQ